MKHQNRQTRTPLATWPVLLAVALLTPAAVRAEEFVTNRFTLSTRFGLNMSARFTGPTSLSFSGNPRTTPRGDLYNYDDGYVLTDISGNLGGQTWYWGYDDSASQISGNTILLNRSTATGDFSSPSFDSDPQLGAELTYNRMLGTTRNLRYGLEAAANYLNLSLHKSSTSSGTLSRVTDAYPFTPGTTPPAATPSNPYQGSFEGPGFVIGDTPVSSTVTIVPGGFTVAGRRDFDADLWGFRLGPYLDLPFDTNFNVWISGGLAVGWLNGEASWSETVTLSGTGSASSSGRGRHDDFLWGGYVAANVSWDFYDRWSVVGGVQYQSLGVYRHNFGTRQAELDFRNSIFATIGLSARF
jgi:hypothetical protein